MDGPSFYDDEQVFETYTKRRNRSDAPNENLEKPVTMELIGDVCDASILDLGCGDAGIGIELLEAGAHAYLGLDGSQNMVATARQKLLGSQGQVVQAEIQAWDYPEGHFDLVISRLALHYIADLAAILHQIFRTLKPCGRLVFSVEHPVITSCDRVWESGVRQDWIVDDYFSTGVRKTEWMNGQVVKYHRTIEDYFQETQAAGFAIDALREAHPQRELFADEELYRRRLRIPLFLFLRAHKPGSKA